MFHKLYMKNICFKVLVDILTRLKVSRKRRAPVTQGTLLLFRSISRGCGSPCTGWCMWWALASCVNTCVVARMRAHRRRGMRRRTSASFLLGSTTTLRTYIFPGGSPTFATIIPVAAAPTRERANVSPLSAFLLGVSALDDHARQHRFSLLTFSLHDFPRTEETRRAVHSCRG